MLLLLHTTHEIHALNLYYVFFKKGNRVVEREREMMMMMRFFAPFTLACGAVRGGWGMQQSQRGSEATIRVLKASNVGQ